MDYDEDVLNQDLSKPMSQFSKNIQRHVTTWIELYKQQKDVALASLVSLIFRACKCPFKVNAVIPENSTWASYLQNVEDTLVLYMEGESTANGEDGKRFLYAKNLSQMIDHILWKSQHDILNDEYFSCNLLQMLNVLSKSTFRVFRHGSTLIALKMLTTLSKIMRNLMKELAVCRRQLSAEQAKTIERRSTERIEILETTFSTLDNESSQIEELIKVLDKQILHPRFRDSCSEICLMCLAELQVWINEFSNYFINPRCLEYLREFLCNSKASILTSTLKLLKWIYSTCEFPEMEAFTVAIEGSILKLSVGRNSTVSTLVIQVASALVENNKKYLKETSIDFIKYLVFSPNHEVSHEAAIFIHKMIMKDLQHQTTNPNFPALYLLQLKDFIVKINGSEKVSLLVESMLSIKDNNYLLEWKSYIVLLLEDELKEEKSRLVIHLMDKENFCLNDVDEGIIISLMLNSLKQIFTEESPRRDKKNKSRQISKVLNQRKNESGKVTEYLSGFLPRVMRKFMPDKSKIVDLLSICSIMNFEHCTRSEDIKLFGEVFTLLSETHVDFQIHIKWAKVLAHFCQGNTMFELVVLRPILEQITKKWKISMQYYCYLCNKKQQSPLSQNMKVDEESTVIFAVINYSSLLWAVGNHFPLEEYVDINELFELSRERLKEEYTVSSQVMEYCYKILHVIILRKAIGTKTVDEVFKAQIEEFCAIGSELLQGNFRSSVSHTAFMCLSENICMLRSIMATSPSWVASCLEAVALLIVKYFSDVVCKKGNLKRKEEEEFIARFFLLIKRRVLPRQAIVYPLLYHTNELIKNFASVVKEAMSVAQSWGMEDFAYSLHEALSLGYQNILYCDEADNAKKNRMFEELQDLAILLMKEYGDSLAKNQKAAVKFHECGLDFATEMRYGFENPLFAAPFIAIINVFEPIIQPNDRRSLMAHLNRRIGVLKSTSKVGSSDLDHFKQYMQSFSSKKNSHERRKHPNLRSRRNLQEEMDMEMEDSIYDDVN